MNPQAEPDADLAALAWQLELGADEAISEAPVDRFAPAPLVAAPAEGPAAARAPAAGAAATGTGTAEAIARACADLAALRAAIEGFEGCALRQGAKRLVFADGDPRARVMIIGEAPGRDEDAAGIPFAGRAGGLLDRMLAATGLSRIAPEPGRAVYLASLLPWRPPGDRAPAAVEIATMLPFLFRHIELAAPQVLVTMGGGPARGLLGGAERIARLRGRWAEWRGLPVLPMFDPARLLRDPARKREAWADLLVLRAKLEEDPHGA